MIGKSFEDASRKAIFSYNDMNKDGRAKIIDPRKAWEEFEPAKNWELSCNLPVDCEAMTAKELQDGALAGGGKVFYPAQFQELFKG